MLFHSLEFALLMTVVFFWYWRLGLRAQRWLLLAASFVFYGAWSVPFIGLILFTVWVDFVAARRIVRTTSLASRRAWLVCSLTCNLGVLAYFKYAAFAVANAVGLLSWVGLQMPQPVLHIVLPLGISFYTFQSMSYTIDVYRGRVQPLKSFSDFLLFVLFFPQLVAGPILRASEFVPQLFQPKELRQRDVGSGLFRIAKGLIKKVVVADALGSYVAATYAAAAQQPPIELLVATYAFALQIYCDFSGYTDIAIGCGRLLGFRIAKNFDRPYLSASITEFWRRWHISLSSWLRDYLYIPLGGNRLGLTRTLANVMITMLLGGLWHGAAWHFVVWGGLLRTAARG